MSDKERMVLIKGKNIMHVCIMRFYVLNNIPVISQQFVGKRGGVVVEHQTPNREGPGVDSHWQHRVV